MEEFQMHRDSQKLYPNVKKKKKKKKKHQKWQEKHGDVRVHLMLLIADFSDWPFWF